MDLMSNSSSSSFIITNKTNETLTIVDFVKENPQLVEFFKYEYSWYANNPRYTQENMIKSAEQNNEDIEPGEYVFGDEDGTVIGHVFDYILRNGGESENFEWRFHEHCR